MAYFVYKFGVQLIICTIILIASSTKGRVRAEPENIISDFLQKFIKPFLRSAARKNAPATNITVIPEQETKIIRLIKRKIAELKPLVQDDDEVTETEDNLTLHGNDETTLIEFLPKKARKSIDGSEQRIILKPEKRDPLKDSIKKYKELREQIKVLLDDEKITEGTKTLILTTLDEIIAKLIESQCTWMPDKKLSIFRNDTSESITKLRNMTKKEWKKLRHHYMDYLTNRKEKENAFMNQFHQFFSSVINDTYNLSERYRIRCQLVQLHNKKKDEPKMALRENAVIEKPKCDNFVVCSNELRDFFIDFYKYVNDTAVSVFKNYASMYVRDVNINFGVDNDVVVSIINGIGNQAERKVTKIYKHELQTFKLNPDKKTHSNIKHITNFIKGVVTTTKAVLNANLIKELGSMKNKLFMTVKEDLSVNLQVDMDNLASHYIDMICTSFVLCNGRYPNRRSGSAWTFRPRTNSEVFVKVQLSLDDEMKNMVAQSGLLQYLNKPNHVKYKLNRDFRRGMNVSVTRTSITTVNMTRTTKILSSTAMPSTANESLVSKLSLPTRINVPKNTSQTFITLPTIAAVR